MIDDVSHPSVAAGCRQLTSAARDRLARPPVRPGGWLRGLWAALACVGAGLLALPAVGLASSGGAGLIAASPGTRTPSAQPGNLTVQASAGGMTIAARESALLGRWLTVAGSLPASEAGRTVDIQLAGVGTGGAWRTVTQTRAAGNGRFSIAWRTSQVGRYALRAVVAPAAGAAAANGVPTIGVTIYRPSLATLYGPGFYGHRTACGTLLRRLTIGVANRTLPCGTPVAVYYGGRVLVVPVIDRGPYANGANWDLTMAAGTALGMSGTETIGAVPLPRPPGRTGA